jgi:hypothetical protein
MALMALIAISNDKKKKVENKDKAYAKIKVEPRTPALDFAKALINYSEGKIMEKPRMPPGVTAEELFVAIKLLGYDPVEIAKKAGLRARRSPLVVIAYPRRALATDQIKRLIRYVYIFNNTLSELELKKKIQSKLKDYLKITISMNYTEVRYVKELLKAFRQNMKNSIYTQIEG